MSTSRRNRQQRFVRAVVYILVLALVIGLIATMVGSALASPASAATASATASAAPAGRSAEPARTHEPDDLRGPVVVLGTVDLTWADLLAAAGSDDASLAAAAAALLAYAGAGQPVNLVTRTAGERTCPADGWLTLGAGSRVRAAERSGDGSAGCRWPADWAEAAGATGRASDAAAQAGALAGVLASAGVTTAGVGRGGVLALTNDDVSPEVGGSPGELLARERPPDLIIADTVPQAADAGGDAAGTAVAADAEDPAGTADGAGATGPAGTADPEAAPSDAERILALAAVLEPLADAPAGTRVIVASVADAADPGPQLAILPPSTLAPETAPDNTFLPGPSTHREGLIQLTDLAPTLARAVGGGTPSSLWSRALAIAPDSEDSAPLGRTDRAVGAGALERARALADDALHARASQRATVPTGLALIGAALALGLAAARALRAPRGAVSSDSPLQVAGTGTVPPGTGAAPPDSEVIRTGPPPSRLRALTRAACLITALPVGLWLANAVPWWRAGGAAVPAALGAGLAFAAGLTGVLAVLVRVALALMERLRPQAARRLRAGLGLAGEDPGGAGPGDLGALVTAQLLVVLPAAMILTDAAQGAPLAFNGPLGMNAVVAGRFYGVSNTAFALASASLLVGITVWAVPTAASQPRERQRALTAAFVAGLGLVALILDAAPQTGADIGGALTLVPALVALGAGLAGVRLGWRRWVVVGAAAVGVVLLLGLGDFLLGGSSTHLGRFFGQLLTGTAGPTLTRKTTALVVPFITSRLALVGLVVGAGATALVARTARRAAHEARQGRGPYAWLARPGALPGWLGPLGRALAVLVVVEVLVNDSGLTMLCFSAAAAVPAITALLVARLVAAPAAPPAPSANGQEVEPVGSVGPFQAR